ncbi:MAG: hypothetical protein H6716_08420 [Polyangiaceae bacterium]|nr:hypothetical protein [Polyangiaceae bacterium]
MGRVVRRWLALSTVVGVGALAAACGDDVQVGDMGDGGAGTSNGGSGGVGGSAGSAAGGSTAGGSGGTPITTGGTGATASGGSAGTTAGTGAGGSGACVPTMCQAHLYKCGNCIDDDNDGLIDSEDPDCLGPCDNTEDSYDSGISGGNEAPCKMDCYFDQDTGNNDGCYWSHECDKLSTPPNYYPSGDSACEYDANANIPGTGKGCSELETGQDPMCESYCGPLTPNGCDCFGCCELPAGGGKYVYLGSEDSGKNPTCTKEDVNDPTKCHPCTPVPSCLNTCEECELCIGKDTLPESCNPPGTGGAGGTGAGGSAGQGTGGTGGGSSQCAAGVQPCGLAGQSPCPSAYYCVTGCCIEAPR